MKKRVFRVVRLYSILLTLVLTGCSKEQPAAQQQEVIVYTSLDKVFSQPILEGFERKTGIKVKSVYDSEATRRATRNFTSQRLTQSSIYVSGLNTRYLTAAKYLHGAGWAAWGVTAAYTGSDIGTAIYATGAAWRK